MGEKFSAEKIIKTLKPSEIRNLCEKFSIAQENTFTAANEIGQELEKQDIKMN